MTKQTLSTAVLCIGAAFVLTTPAHAGDIITSTIPDFGSTDGYDYSTTFPGDEITTAGTFTFTIPAGVSAGSITISGSFGNPDDGFGTALSDYYLGDSLGDGELAVEVAGCDDPTNNCASGDLGITDWTTTLTQAQIADLTNGLEAGTLDFSYTWDSSPPVIPTPGFDQYVNVGAATLDITPTPEPATALFCFGGLAGLAAFRRFRKL